jgi:hypothetical protein
MALWLGNIGMRGMTDAIRRLQIAETAKIDTGALILLQQSLGVRGSEDVIERAVICVAENMGVVEQALITGDLPGMEAAAHNLVEVGEQMGFNLLATVARDLTFCTGRQDTAAQHAVAERLMRVGDASLVAAIEGAVLPD